jgi:DNA-binding IclR family transcriptional regulator
MMFFWGSHPSGRFDEQTICYALDHGASEVRRELQALVDTGFVERGLENGTELYRLTANEFKRSCIVEWASPGHPGR